MIRTMPDVIQGDPLEACDLPLQTNTRPTKESKNSLINNMQRQPTSR